MTSDARAYIACGYCEQVCPEKALRFDAHGDERAPSVAEALTRHRRRACLDCGVAFAAPAEEERCPTCRKSRAAFAAFLSGPGAQE